MSAPSSFSEIFILSPANSGTTVMAKLLLRSPRVWASTPTAEGQKLPAAAHLLAKEPWKLRQKVRYHDLKKVWEAGRPEGSIMLEKSPPNMIRTKDVAATWPAAFFVISLRDPRAVVASRLIKGSGSREEAIAAARGWVRRAQIQRANAKLLEGRCMVTSYEQFTAFPHAFIERLEEVFGPLGVDADAPVEVKRYSPAPITNHNERQISAVDPALIRLAGELLQEEAAEELAYWAY